MLLEMKAVMKAMRTDLAVLLFLHTWQKINTDPVCFGARDENNGSFSIPKTERVKKMKPVHKSGWIKCTTDYPESYWGCTHPEQTHKLTTIITNANRPALLPPFRDLEGKQGCVEKHSYSLEGTGHKSPELVFRNPLSPLSLSRDQELQIWYGQDWIDCTEFNNGRATCVDVYAWYI